jgi:hypothetical protein
MANQGPDDPDRVKWLHEMAREDAHREHDRTDRFLDQLNESAIKGADSALRACLLINGGAAVSVLAFIGGLASRDVIGVSQLKPIADSLVPFALGVVAAVVGMGLSYLVHYLGWEHRASQTRIWEHPWLIPGKNTQRIFYLRNTVHGLAAVVGVASAVFFVCGVFAVRNSVENIRSAAYTQVPSAS